MNTHFGTAKFAEDMESLLNDSWGTDIQLKVGGGNTVTVPDVTTGETIFNSTEVITIHAHSVILRCRSKYFANIFNNERSGKKSRKGFYIYQTFPRPSSNGPSTTSIPAKSRASRRPT